jgi:hypothetical protein
MQAVTRDWDIVGTQKSQVCHNVILIASRSGE